MLVMSAMFVRILGQFKVAQTCTDLSSVNKPLLRVIPRSLHALKHSLERDTV